MMSSRQPITVDRSAIPCLINLGHCPAKRRYRGTTLTTEATQQKSSDGFHRPFHVRNLFQTLESPTSPVGVPICSGVTPSTSVPEKRAITPSSSIGISIRVNTRQVLKFPNHGRIIMPQHIKFEDILINIMEVKSESSAIQPSRHPLDTEQA